MKAQLPAAKAQLSPTMPSAFRASHRLVRSTTVNQHAQKRITSRFTWMETLTEAGAVRERRSGRSASSASPDQQGAHRDAAHRGGVVEVHDGLALVRDGEGVKQRQVVLVGGHGQQSG